VLRKSIRLTLFPGACQELRACIEGSASKNTLVDWTTCGIIWYILVRTIAAA